jgi:hypothetical protein
MRRTHLLAVVAAACIPAALIVAGGMPAGASTVATGSVTGTVVNAATSAALPGICVNVVDAANNQTVGTSPATGKAGVWTLKGIPTSTTYTATAYGCKNPNFVGQWYNKQEFQSEATQFTVAAGQTTTQINFSLTEGGSVAGKVTDSVTKDPVAGILVVAYWTTAQQPSTFAACTPSTGLYKLRGVPTSGAKIEFLPNDCGVSSTYGVIWYHHQSSYSTATVVPVTAGATTTGISQRVTAAG